MICARPCLRPVYTAAHGRVQTVYTAVHGPRTWSVRDSIMAVYATRTRPCTAVYREHGLLYDPCARHCTYRVHGRSRGVRIVYTGVQGPCTWCVHGHVQGTPTRSCTLYLGVFTCERPCTRVVNTPVYMTAVYGRAVIRPCARVMDAPLHGGVHGPYTVVVMYCVRVRAMNADGCVNEVRPRTKLKPRPRPTPRPRLRL